MGSRILRPVAAAVAITLVYLGPCGANPVPLDAGEAPADTDRSGAGLAAPSALPGASVPLAGVSRGAVPPDQAQQRAEALAAARDPALLPIDMRGVGAQAHPAPSALPKVQAGDAGVDEDGLRKLAASARGWMREVFGRPDDARNIPVGDAMPGVDDLGLPVETQASGVRAMPQRAARPVEVPPPEAMPRRAVTATAAHESAGARLLAQSAPEYAIQRFLKRCRQVLVHPLTWLAIVLVAATHIAMSRGRR